MVPVIKVKAITHRRHPILQTCIGPSDEHTNMAGIPTEASILQLVERALPGFVQNVHCPSPGTGKYLAVLQVKNVCQTMKVVSAGRLFWPSPHSRNSSM